MWLRVVVQMKGGGGQVAYRVALAIEHQHIRQDRAGIGVQRVSRCGRAGVVGLCTHRVDARKKQDRDKDRKPPEHGSTGLSDYRTTAITMMVSA